MLSCVVILGGEIRNADCRERVKTKVEMCLDGGSMCRESGGGECGCEERDTSV